ncbi:hypothetical protein EAH80_07845 [Mycobacterium hodleri]|uniref:Uncharacterized protein n=1 Tax=Mycolicibacterium hodleri TaxID=49897 RepID=A0A502EEP3_9MYCO|nr:hypothetical protein EAH80_07845 [Mycolicibacterium hodleri]
MLYGARPADRQTFLPNMRRRKPEPGLDRNMLFLLATAKLNQAERFGFGLGETYGLNSDEGLPPGTTSGRGGPMPMHLTPEYPCLPTTCKPTRSPSSRRLSTDGPWTLLADVDPNPNSTGVAVTPSRERPTR